MVQIPMPNDAAQPVGLFLATRSHQEAADRSLPTFVVAVQQVNDDALTGGNPLADHLPVGVARIAYGCLPKTDVTRWDEEVSGLRAKRIRFRTDHWWRCGTAELGPLFRAPRLQNGVARPNISKRQSQVQSPIDRFHRGPATAKAHPVVVSPSDLLRGVLEAGRKKERSQSHLECSFGRSGCVVRRANRGERGNGQDERACGCSQRCDCGPIDGPEHFPRLRLTPGRPVTFGAGHTCLTPTKMWALGVSGPETPVLQRAVDVRRAVGRPRLRLTHGSAIHQGHASVGLWGTGKTALKAGTRSTGDTEDVVNQ
jgi:hypothetical protein